MADFDVKFCPHCGEEIDYVTKNERILKKWQKAFI